MLDSLTNVQMSSGQLPRHKVEMFKNSCVHLKGNYNIIPPDHLNIKYLENYDACTSER